MRAASDALKSFIKRSEDCFLEPHWDAIGKVWDIGYGHVIKEGEPRRPITQQQADDLFSEDLREIEEAVAAAVEVPLTQGQFDALVSFAYNVGTGALRTSTLLKYLNASLYPEAALQFLLWHHSHKKDVPGLLLRRAKELLIFQFEDYTFGV